MCAHGVDGIILSLGDGVACNATIHVLDSHMSWLDVQLYCEHACGNMCGSRASALYMCWTVVLELA